LDSIFINIVKEVLKTKKKVAVITHVNPDGDAMGSALALYGIFTKEQHDVKVIIPNEFPSFLAWMPYSEKILINKLKPAECKKAIDEADVIFCVDFNDIYRIEDLGQVYKESKAVKFLIDHHLSPSSFADHTLSLVETSSTAEIIWDLIEALGKIKLIDKSIAECLYVGIVTDTGSFSYSCNYEKTYLVTAELFRYGINGEHIHRLVYDTFTENRMRLLGYCLSEKMKVLQEFKTAYISLTKEELAKFHYQNGDTEGVVNFALSVEGIEMAALFMERDKHIKISFRSKGGVSVNDIARKYYDGGGHHNAAGGFSYVSMKDTLIAFKKLLPVVMLNTKVRE
jgi:bifunctional oligoribonuclease and PAP phosphatase NrnA